ncbi:MAG: hypothetical protein RBT33_00540, partial [Candidatus Dojkabacteria bacterium]|nr:hypothetical protein [Candidatus Dojkabacteria bacterium]
GSGTFTSWNINITGEPGVAASGELYPLTMRTVSVAGPFTYAKFMSGTQVPIYPSNPAVSSYRQLIGHTPMNAEPTAIDKFLQGISRPYPTPIAGVLIGIKIPKDIQGTARFTITTSISNSGHKEAGAGTAYYQWVRLRAGVYTNVGTEKTKSTIAEQAFAAEDFEVQPNDIFFLKGRCVLTSGEQWLINASSYVRISIDNGILDITK